MLLRSPRPLRRLGLLRSSHHRRCCGLRLGTRPHKGATRAACSRSLRSLRTKVVRACSPGLVPSPFPARFLRHSRAAAPRRWARPVGRGAPAAFGPLGTPRLLSLGRLCGPSALRGRSLLPSALGPPSCRCGLPVRSPLLYSGLALRSASARRVPPPSPPSGLRGRAAPAPGPLRPYGALAPAFGPGAFFARVRLRPLRLRGLRVSLRSSIIAARSRLPFGAPSRPGYS